MDERLRALIWTSSPRFASLGSSARTALIARKARHAFEHAGVTPAYLGEDTLEVLQDRYPYPPAYGYDEASARIRGRIRAKEILHLAVPGNESTSFLELGCSEGMVCHYLSALGKKATGIDVRVECFSAEAAAGGAQLLVMNAAKLEFESGTFDVVFSYNSFEHFRDPEQVLREAGRVTRKGGLVYLLFGPLYFSPRGLHAYHAITVPYCQHLFAEDTILRFVSRKNLPPVDFSDVNKWRLPDYRGLWNRLSGVLEKIRCYEVPFVSRSQLKLVEDYPSCFRSKTASFDDLTVSYIDILFRKR